MEEAQNELRIVIAGMGPVGMILGAHLVKAGCDVVVCDTDRLKANLIRNEGIVLSGIIESKTKMSRVVSSLDEIDLENTDLLILALKSYQTAGLLKSLSGKKTGNLCVLSAQNGIDTDKVIADQLGENRTLRLVINFAGNQTHPNTVKVTFFNAPNYIASLDDSQSLLAKRLVEKLNQEGLQTDLISSFEIIKRVWEKTILNASLSPLCGIGKLTIREAMEMADTVELIEQVISEAVEVAEAEKIRFEDDFIRKCLRYLKKAGDHFPSMAVDLINNRQTEIDHFNGKIVEYGRKHYIRTALNLSMTNMVKAMTRKNLLNQLSVNDNRPSAGESVGNIVGLNKVSSSVKNQDCFLGIDLGSAYTKITVVNGTADIVYQTLLKTHNRDKMALKHVMHALQSEFRIAGSCATGYGRKQFPDADIIKTEINCAAVGVSHYFKGEKNIIDIGGEDIKVIQCDQGDLVENFYLNDKCAAGTGSFLSEIAERAGIEISDMSILASKSASLNELNSFCTVFAKTEIMNWMFDGVPVEDVSKGVYLSIVNRMAKMRINPHYRVLLIGGVVAFHPYLKTILATKLETEPEVVPRPQYITSFGAALIASQMSGKKDNKIQESFKKEKKNEVIP
jgi:2-dehydropantoate 2-reductase